MTEKGLVSSRKAGGLDAVAVRREFPVLDQRVHGKRLVYLDSAATSQKPQAVIDAITEYYSGYNANIHRAVHALGERATNAYEGAREKVARFVNAPDPRGIVFTRGTTEAINLVARSFVRPRLQPGDEVLITHMEHHSNIVPWQLMAAEAGADLKVAPVDDEGNLDLDAFHALLSDRTRFVSLSHVSNALGTVNPVKDLVRVAHEKGIPILVDGAQAVPHRAVDVQDIGADFYAFSAHKMYGPTGVGALVAARDTLERMDPYQGGGDMIKSVTFEKTLYNDVPFKFEAGTPNIAGVIGFGAAVDFLTRLGMEHVAAHERHLLAYLVERLDGTAGVTIIGRPRERSAVVSFALEGVHPHDVGTLLDREGVAIRTGHHCAMPLMRRYNVPATCRASLGIYNGEADVDVLVESLARVRGVFA
jgi:cysteine desulfurase / selenocysteine lyase